MTTEQSPPPLPPSSPPPLLVSRWRWGIHLGILLAYVAPNIVFAERFVRRQPILSRSASGLLVVCLIQIAIFAAVFGLAWLFSRASREQLLLPWRPGWWPVPLGFVYSIAIRLGLGIAVSIVMLCLIGARIVTPNSAQHFFSANRPTFERLVDPKALQNDPAYFWLIVTVGSFVVAGLREELWRSGTLAAMRALWPDVFDSTNGQFLAVALIAVPFGAAHLGMGIMAAVIAGALGLCLGVIMVYHRSIWPAIIAHGFLDATTFALLPWAIRHMALS